MANPYWGQLPPPKITRGNSLKSQKGGWRVRGNDNQELSINTDMMAGGRSPGGSPDRSHHFQPRQARYSNQTDKTEAPTISTQSPFASPVASEFRGDGLAPRPSSFAAAAGISAKYNSDFAEKRRRRETRNRDSYEAASPVPPPAAPDAPRAPPPVSYKDPYSNGASNHQASVRPRSTRRSEGPVSPGRGPPEEYYRPHPTEEYHPGDEDHFQSRKLEPSNGKAPTQQAATRRGAVERTESNTSQPRRVSLSEAEAQRRREWAPDRSPLQRLELTLDSITKEEKRARVEEAELLIREASAGRSGERATQNSVRFRNRPVAKAPEPGSRPEPQSLSEAGLVRNLSTKQRDQLYQGGADERRQRPSESSNRPVTATARGFDYQPHADQIEKSTLNEKGLTPQRANSSRDRSFIPVAVAGGIAAGGVARRTSNKLRKDPPGDPWLHKRLDAEKRYPDGSMMRKPSVDSPQQVTATAGPSRDTAFRSHPQVIDKELPKLPVEDIDSDEMGSPSKTGRKGTSSKLGRLAGPRIPVQSPNSGGQPAIQTQRVTVNGTQYPVETSPAASGAHHHAAEQGAHSRHHHLSDVVNNFRHKSSPNDGVYIPSPRLDDWKKGATALLSGSLLDLDAKSNKIELSESEKDKAWWEGGNTGHRRRSITSAPRKAEAYDGEYDESNAPTRFKPPLFLKSGPLLRYCGIRREKIKSRSGRNVILPDREVWRGTVMIVTQDDHSSYELAPTLRIFLQPVDLLPPPPAQVDGEIDELAPEYVDPIAGLPKIGRDGRTLYVRPIDHIDEEKDLSRVETDDGLFETERSQLDGSTERKTTCPKPHYDGEKAGKYKEVRGFRLHTEQGVTFWRFNIEVELREKQQRIAYRINRGPATPFWVPARATAMNIMFHSCNGFSHDVDPNNFCGPDPMWRDVLNTHQTQPFHVMLGGGDQLYNDLVMEEAKLFREWSNIKDPFHKERAPWTPELQLELETFYLNRYCMWFSQGLFGLAASQIPMINVFDDHDIIDGFGSYSTRYMESPIFSGLGMVAFKFYMLFQHQSSIDEGEETEPTWILGTQPGPFIKELSRSIFTSLGSSIAFLGLDCRTERMNDEIVSAETYHKVFDRLSAEIVKGEMKHLIVLVGIPVAYPRMVWLENLLTSRAIEPIKAMGRAGLLGKSLLNHIDGGVEILDDLDDHWTAKHHKDERNWFIQELQDLAAEKSIRVTILGGDVHLAAIGQFYSNPKLGIPKDHDFRYMPNVISSAIVNAPPPDALADLLNRRNKIHHLDAETDEDMIPIFTHDVNGKPRNNKRLLNRRNWCSIRQYDPELSPPPTPQTDGPPSPPPKRGLLRRFSTSRGPAYRPDAAALPPPSNAAPFARKGSYDAPPLSSPGFFGRQGSTSRRGSVDSQRPSLLTRTLSLNRKNFIPTGLLRRGSKRRADSGGINGYGEDTDTEDEVTGERYRKEEVSGIRGGSGGNDGFGDDEGGGGYFPQMPPVIARQQENPIEQASTSIAGHAPQPTFERSKFQRTPTGLSEKQIRKGGIQDINLEGGLDICLNIEVNPKDPAGITMPYRLLVPALWYDESQDRLIETKHKRSVTSGIKRWRTLKKYRPPETGVAEE